VVFEDDVVGESGCLYSEEVPNEGLNPGWHECILKYGTTAQLVMNGIIVIIELMFINN